MFGNKFIVVYNGKMDIHGKKRLPTWTLLSATADAAVTSINLKVATDW